MNLPLFFVDTILELHCLYQIFGKISGEKVSIATLTSLAPKYSWATYVRKTGVCSANKFYGNLEGTITAIRFGLDALNRPKILQKAYYGLKFTYTAAFSAVLHIYAVIPSTETNYILSCKYAHFRSGLHFGPVIWQLTVMHSGEENVVTPDLKEILLPILRSEDPAVHSMVYLVFEWKEFLIGNQSPNGALNNYLHLLYRDKEPGNLLCSGSYCFVRQLLH